MEKNHAEKYPLLKYFEFELHITGKGGEGCLLIPKKDIFVPKRYGFGHLALIPYLQEFFNENKTIKVRELKEILREENEISLSSDYSFNDEPPFLHRVINGFKRKDIIKFEKRVGKEGFIFDTDILAKGESYDQTRVYSINPYNIRGLEEESLYS